MFRHIFPPAVSVRSVDRVHQIHADRAGNACSRCGLMNGELEDPLMTKERPDDTEATKTTEIMRLHEQLDPPVKFPVDPQDRGPKRSQKQPGQDLDGSPKDADDGE